MIKLAHVSFARPIPIPGTHERLADFAVVDGWTIEDDDGKTWLSREACEPKSQKAVRFYTYVNGSCLPLQDLGVSGGEAAVMCHAPAVAQEAGISPAAFNAGREQPSEVLKGSTLEPPAKPYIRKGKR
jgi:hypothetical protein